MVEPQSVQRLWLAVALAAMVTIIPLNTAVAVFVKSDFLAFSGATMTRQLDLSRPKV